MDPLSISASIAGLITLTELIVSRGYELVKGVKNAKHEITQLLVEITALFGVLQSLRLVALRFEGQYFDTTLQLEYIQSCQKLVDRIHGHLKATLPEDSDGRWRAAGKSLRWPLSAKETKVLIAEVGKHKATLSLALNVDGVNALLEVLSQQQTLSNGQDRIQDGVKQIQADLEAKRIGDEIAAARKERQEMLKEWPSINPEPQHAAAVRLRHPGTGKWFLEGDDFEAFAAGHIPALWVCGIPGAGKTVLSSSIIETLKANLAESTTQGLAYFYCDYKDAATQQAANIISSLVKHAAIQNDRSCEDLRLFLANHKRDGMLGSTPGIVNLTDLIVKMIGHYDRFYVVVDAIDECPDFHRHEVLCLLKNIATNSSNARVVYTSREEDDIKKAFDDFKSVRIKANIGDLELYVASEIQTRTTSGRLNIKHSEVKEKIIHELVNRADGMFRWVTCQLEDLCDLPSDRARLLALETLPPDLSKTYERILDRVVARNEDVQKIVERTLRWTLGSIRSLTIPELIEAITIEEDEDCLDEYAKVEEEEIFRCCKSLIRKNANENKVELAHFTVEEFLNAIDPAKTPKYARFAALKETADLELGRKCLTYLNFEAFGKAKVQDIFWLSSKSQFWSYAAFLWHKHAKDAWEDVPTRHLLQRFFHHSISSHFVTWNRYKCLKIHNKLPDTQGWYPEQMYREYKINKFEQIDSIIPLHQAAFLALEKLTQWLVSEGSDLNKASIMGTPLECALRSEVADEHVVSILLEYGADIHTTSGASDGYNPLTLAMRTQNPNILKSVLDAGAAFDMSCKELNDRMLSTRPALLNSAPIYPSTAENSMSMLKQSSPTFQEYADNVDVTLQDAALTGQLDMVAKTMPSFINTINSRAGYNEYTALHCASMNGHHNVVRYLLEKGADVNVQDKNGNTPAHLCIKQGSGLKILDLLIAHRARIQIMNKDHMNLLHVAAQTNRRELLAFLLARDLTGECRNMRARNGATLVQCALAAETRSLETIRFTGNALTVSECLAGNDQGETGLHLATKDDDMDSMRFFLDKGNLDERTDDGETALHLAVTLRESKAAQLLLDRGADICLTTKDGQTLLHFFSFGMFDILDTILSAQGISNIINKKDWKGRAPIHVAMEERWFTTFAVDIMGKFLKVPAFDVNVLDETHTSLLIRLVLYMDTHAYCQKDIHNATKLLLTRDLKLDKQDLAGATALHRLCALEITTVVALTIELLLDQGVDDLLRDEDGSLAVEIMLRNFEQDEQVEGLQHHQLRILKTLLDRISDEELNALNREGTRPFVFALQYNAQALAEELALRTSDVEASYTKNASALSPLDACCTYECDFRIFEILASRSKDLSKKGNHGFALLHLACLYNKGDILRYLLARKVDIELEGRNGSTALDLSMRYGRPEIMDALLAAGANPSHLHPGSSSTLHAAALSPSPDLLDKLLQRSKILDLEARASYGYTPLMCAIASGRGENVDKLLVYGAKLSAIDDGANGALHLASVTGNPMILKSLMQKSSPLNKNGLNNEGRSPLLLAAAKSHHAAVALLLEAGCDTSIKDEYQQKIMHYVALSGQSSIFNLLKSESVAFHLENKNCVGRTPLLCAIEQGHVLMVRKLLNAGADIQAKGTDGFGLLHLAAHLGRAAVISEVFFRFGARSGGQEKQRQAIDINAGHPVSGDTPLAIAAAQGHLAAFQALLGNGADLKRTNRDGMNALHVAAASRRDLIIKATFAHCKLQYVNLDVNVRDKKGRTALTWLERSGIEDAVEKRIARTLINNRAKRLELTPEQVSERKEQEWWKDCGGLCNVD